VTGRPHIREATLADVPALHRFARALFGERLPTITATDPDISLSDEEQFVRPYVERHDRVLLVATDGDDVVGVLNFEGREQPQFAHSGRFGISVRRDWRGRGVGSRLLDAIEPWAIAHGFRRLELEVFANNQAAERLYERKGYVREGCRRGALLVGRDYVDVIEMTKVLA
jgi:RimJ/RimL family protein N-acetyltransferase